MNYINEQENARRLANSVIDVARLLEKYNVEYWLDYGALLGIIRENRLLPWDNDVELSCWSDSLKPEIIRAISVELNKSGYDVYYSIPIGIMSIRSFNGIQIVIHTHAIDGEIAVRPHEYNKKKPLLGKSFYWSARIIAMSRAGKITKVHLRSFSSIMKLFIILWVGILPKNVRKKLFLTFVSLSKKFGGEYQKTGIPAKYFNILEKVDFYGFDIPIPTNTEEYLELIYGKEWRIPKSGWHYYFEEYKEDTGIAFIDEAWDYSKSEI